MLWWFLTSGNGSQRSEKSSCPSSSAFISTFSPFYVCVCVYLSVTDKSRFGPNRLCGLVLSLGHVGCQEAHKCPPCLEELSVKMLPPNQSLTGHTRHEFGCENKHKEIQNKYIKQDIFGWACAPGWATACRQNSYVNLKQ